jgi:hypothetical protein
MDDFLKRIFYDELARQCDFVIMGHKQLVEVALYRHKGIIESLNKGVLDLDSDRTFEHSTKIDNVFFLIQGILVSCANISKILWPGPTKHKALQKGVDERASCLRGELKIEKPHLLENRSMRDSYEHFDERLHTWFNESDQKNFVDTSIGTLGAVGGIATKDMLRWYDPDRDWLVFRGHFYKLGEVVSAVKSLRSQINSQVRVGHADV